MWDPLTALSALAASTSDLFVRGGPLMVPIVAFSVVALAVFLGRLATLREARVLAPARVRHLRELVARGETSAALALAQEGASPVERVLRVGLEHAGATRAAIKERMEEVGRREAADLMRTVGLVGTIASIEPLLGLLGTVTGMIGVFQGVVTEGVGDPSALASGIWEALLTTAAGLSAAIPAYLGWRYLVGRADELTLAMEGHAVELLEHVASDGARARRAGANGEATDGLPVHDRAA